ncbi:MAG: hypothetical protein JXR73_17410 [Candidatus Omnitrophica bacterium]|nr:hypothetical protein [Candidatus Omnitrophota bacterium]
MIIAAAAFDFGPWIIALELFLLAALVVMTVLIYRNRRYLKRERGVTETLGPDQGMSIQELVDRARKENPHIPLNIILGSGSYNIEEGVKISSTVRFQGASVEKTRIVSSKGHPAVTIQDAKNCSISDVRVEGSVQCRRGEVTLKNCHIVAKEDGICIEAYDNSIITFSGAISGEGGVAIRAKGESKVFLKPPYALSGDDFILVDPKSRIAIEDRMEPPPAQI